MSASFGFDRTVMPGIAYSLRPTMDKKIKLH
jgi:hypothetical protein